MDINASIIVQMLVFVVFVGLTMKFIWPVIIKILETRKRASRTVWQLPKKATKSLD